MEISQEYKKSFSKGVMVFLVIISVYFGIKVLSELKSIDMMSNQGNAITISGHGEVSAVPDIAAVYFSVEASQPTQEAASNEVNTKVKSIMDFLKSSGIEEKDIKTDNYSSYPKYSNPRPCPYYGNGGTICVQEEGKIIGFSVSQSITVKVRKIDSASAVIDGINKIGVSNMSGPNFTIDDEDGLKAEARRLAILDAKAKAKVLAKDLGMNLGKIVSFSDNNGYYEPMYYGGDMMKAESSMASVAAELPAGENTISSDVSITYQLK